MSTAWRQRTNYRRYRRMRLVILANAGHRCQVQLPGVCTVDATVVHHTRGKGVTGDDPRFMVASCAECNGKIGEPATHAPQPRRVTKW